MRYFYFGLILFFLYLISSPDAKSQDLKSRADSVIKTVRPFLMLQSWGVYTRNEMADLQQNGMMQPVEDRMNFYFRRARLGFKGEPQNRLRYTLVLYYDNLGRDDFTAVRGRGNNDADFGIWDAFVQWQITEKNDALHLTAGYFRPQISRENLTSAWEVNSFEKSISQLYVRRQLVERNHGRASGVNLGGLWLGKKTSLYYNVGAFNPTNTSTDSLTMGNSAGVLWSPLWAGRVSFTYGDPEMVNYSIAHEINYYNQRRGLTLGTYASHQSRTDLFEVSQVWGVDLLFNYDNFNLDAEFNVLRRRFDSDFVYSQTGHVRSGFNISISEKLILEPAVMWAFFEADEASSRYAFFTGWEQTWDVGLNFYMQKTRFKTNIHYVWQNGAGRNLYTRQDGRQVEKGDYLALGLQFII
ncbi:MAG: hypothetical protein JJT94_05710 [Bernardetiaceae bacterium]|nr:hypothetical protein [Bernardetiaceae bacterium]